MKKYLFAVVTGCLGLCAGFTLCYVSLVLRDRGTVEAASALQQPPAQDRVVVTIATDGTLYLAGERLDLKQLETRLKELAGQRRIDIRADKGAPITRVVAVMDAAKAAARKGGNP